MTRAAKIAAIHTKREANALVAQGYGVLLSDIAAALRNLERIRAELIQRVEDEPREWLASWAVPLRDLSGRVAREQSALERVLTRLSRSALNIGMVGRARQGKSRFLQSLTGLTAREIPDGSGRFCTGVPSMVQHMPGHDTYADVYFHSPASFLTEVIGPYYELLGLGTPPDGLEEFSRGPLPALRPDSSADAQSAYGHLGSYHKAFPEYGSLIGATSPRRIADTDIRSFVAQDDETGHLQYHAFRAVRHVHIATAFAHPDMGGVGVIDLPGLGDTNLGDSKVMLSALEDDVDLVLFLRKPAPEGDSIHDFDVNLYDIARSALPEIPMERRSFLILNHRRSDDPVQDNLERCEEFRDEVAGSPIRVARAEIADCSSAEEVLGAFDPIVDYLIDNISDLDRLLLNERTRGVSEICQEALLLVEELSKLSRHARPSGDEFPLFQELFAEVYQNLSVGIERLVEKYKDGRNTSNSYLQEAVSATMARARADTGIPDTPEIENRFYLDGGHTLAYGRLLHETRAHLSRHFLDLDAALKESVQQMWDEVTGVLAQSGQLAALSDSTGRDFLLSLAERIPPGVRRGGESEVRYALQILTDFDLSYRSFIQHRIRYCLDGMHIDHPKIRIKHDGSPPDGAEVHEALDLAYQETLYECEQKLKNLLSEPNMAVFGIIEEFCDRVLRSHRVKDEWRAIYEDIRAEIWTDQFEALAENAGHMRTWNEAVQRLSALLNDGTTRLAGPDIARQAR